MHKLRTLRKRLGLTQDDVAELLGCDRTSVSKKESGERPLTYSEMELLVERFREVDPDVSLVDLASDAVLPRTGTEG
ncbi:MAG: helix-turn-helix transcriptional regulator [bacterium]|nr:helix-turn-helix transcriptional regulator [bacterium]